MLSDPLLAQIWDNVTIYWIIPAGMLALYFYGKFHFNTPEYLLDLGNSASPATTAGLGARLITPAPPIFTASRGRYNRYARRYVVILEAAFIALVFFSSFLSGLVSDASGLNTSFDLSVIIPSSADSLQKRAILALFALTGLLSSFPGFKEIDNWLLRALHKAAFIPDEVRILAETLYGSPFSAPTVSVAAVTSNLSMRDLLGVANGKLTGRLEQRLINLLCLRSELLFSRMSSQRHTRFKIKLDRDLQEIEKQSQGLKAEVRAYLRDQERLVPNSVSDIDEFLSDQTNHSDVAELLERRQLLQSRCDTLYETMCLLTALFVFATESTPEDVGEALAEMGFTISIPVIPPFDWDTVARVIGSMFLLMVALNGAYALFNYFLGFGPVLPTDPHAVRIQVIRYALLFTVVYSAVMFVVILLKRKWRSGDEPDSHRPENLSSHYLVHSNTIVFFPAIRLYC
jgi:hypothetical protein